MLKQKDIDIDLDHEALVQKYPLYKFYYKYLIDKYDKANLKTEEVITEIEISYSTFNTRKNKGVNLPCYMQNPNICKAKIYFPLPCVALFLAKDLVRTI